MIWPLVSAFIYTVNKRVGGINLFENYIQFIVVIIALPSLLGIAGVEMQVVAVGVLYYFLKVWPKKNREAEKQ